MKVPTKEKQEEVKLYVQPEVNATFGGDNMEKILLSPYRISKSLLLVVFALLALHFVVCHVGLKFLELVEGNADYSTYEEVYYIFYNQFHLALDSNIPTFFSSLNLTVASLLLFIIHSTGKRDSNHWLYLCLIFLFLAVDESAQIHETFGGLAGQEVNSYLGEVPPFLSWAWMVPYAVLTVLVGLYFLKFTLKLPGKTRALFFLSGGVYVFGALFLEFLESHFDTVYGPENLVNKFLFPIEEVLEMTGVIIFIYALLDYLMMHRKALSYSFTNR